MRKGIGDFAKEILNVIELMNLVFPSVLSKL